VSTGGAAIIRDLDLIRKKSPVKFDKVVFNCPGFNYAYHQSHQRFFNPLLPVDIPHQIKS
jgi:hypothetical protein